jgi:hypothetical protein
MKTIPAFASLSSLLLVAILQLYGCDWRVGPDPVTPVPTVDPDDPPVPDEDDCAAAQKHLEELNCEEATTPGGTPFGEACARAEADTEANRDWHPECIRTIQDCAEFDDASRGELCR